MLLPASASAFEITLSGQVNRLIMSVDNGEESGVVNADNSVSGTRVRVKGHGEVNDDLTAGIYYEYQLQSNPSDKIMKTASIRMVLAAMSAPATIFPTGMPTSGSRVILVRQPLARGAGLPMARPRRIIQALR